MYIPFDYQVECLNAIQTVREQGSDHALIVMASGLGKTVTMALDTKRWREGRGKGRVLFLCHNNDILYQAKTTFQAVNGSDCTYGYLHGGEKNLHRVDFLFASLQTMERYKELFDSAEFSYILVDESHHSQAKTYRSTIEYFDPEFLLGATATPDRLDEEDIRDIFGSEVYYLPLEEALARGLLTPVDYRLITDEIQLNGLGKDAELGRHVSRTELNRRIFIPKRDEEIAKIIANYTSEFQNPRVIIFCPSIRYCDHLARFVPDSFAIHSHVPEQERAVKLEMFRQGLVGTVLAVNAFNEGIDIPQANVVVFLRSTVSRTIFLQQLGRGLRKSEGKDKVVALDFVANCERIEMVHQLWSKIEDDIEKHPTEREIVGVNEPMILNVNSVEFTEKIYPLLKLMDRLILPSKETLIGQLTKEATSLGRTPKFRDIRAAARAERMASCQVFIRVFGSFNNALEAADLPINQHRSSDLSQSILIAQLQEEGKRLGRTPRSRDIKAASKQERTASAKAFTTAFGSINKALEAAGFSVTPAPQRSLTKNILLARLRKEAKRLGRTPGYSKMPIAAAYIKAFGSWENAVEAAGLSSNHVPAYSRESLIIQLQEEAKRLEKTPTVQDVKAACRAKRMASDITFTRTFGSHNEALQAAGLTPNRLPKS